MRKFINNLIIFFVVGIAIIFLLIFSMTYNIKKNASFKIAKKIDKIVLGHSHPECAFDDSLIPNFANFANSGESYFYTYFKIKKLLEQNKQIKIIFIEFTNNQISEDMNEWTWGKKYMSYRHPLYAPFMDLNDEKFLLVKNPKVFLSDLGIIMRKGLFWLVQNEDYTKIIGGYLHLDRDKTQSIIDDINSGKSTEEFSEKISNYNIYYLEKIIKYCKEKNVKVFLIRSPLHSKYQGFKNERQFQKILNSKFADVEFLDFNNVPLENSEFGDLEHLNYHGAERFSLFFRSLLAKGLLEKENKQKIINFEIDNSFGSLN